MTNPPPPLLHHLFEVAARAHPGRVAVEVPPGTGRPHRCRVTYAELLGRAESVAAALRPWARRDAVVAILLPRDAPTLYAAQLGVLRAGAAYVCLDPKFPDAYLRVVLDDARAVALLTDPAGRARLATLGVRLPPLLDPSDLPGGAGRAVDGAPSDLAYVVYTSGTTGRPKGVMIEHRGVVNLVTANVGYFGLGPGDRVAQCSSPAYDSSVEETWLAFAVGATLVPLDDDTVRLGPDLVPWLRDERVTVLCPPPTLLRATGCTNPQGELPALRLLYVGGEPLPADLAERWAAGRRMENGYGPTECTVTVVRGPVRPGHPVTIGTPVRGHRAWVLDEALREVPPGEAGELCLAGVGLARGYLRCDARTAEKFPHHPRFGRLYRTGDLVRRTPTGELEHLGRLDGQVKLRGYRIELGAVEAGLTACPGVRAAGCRVQGAGARQLLVAHVVPADPDAPPCLDALKESLRRALPAYMVPARLGLLDRLPTSVGGKLDRQALPEIVALAREVAPPRDEYEARVAAAFARALGLADGVSRHDDFFLDLGGDSLSAVGAACALRESGCAGAAVAARDLYEARTVAALAERLRRRRVAAAGPPRRGGDRPRGRPVVSTVIQGACLALGLVLGSATAALVTFGLLPFLLREAGLVTTALLALAARVLGPPLYAPGAVAWTMLVKKILIGRYRPGRFPVWGSLYTRHWVVCHAARLIPWALLEGTLFQAAVLRALGARVGRGVHLHRGVDLTGGGWDLLALGDDVTLAQEAAARVADLAGGQLILGPVTVGDGATIDIRAGLSPHTTVERNGYLTALSWLPEGGRIPEGECWDGVPAAATGKSPWRPAPSGGELPPLTHGLLVVLGRCAGTAAAWLPVVLASVLAARLVPGAEARLLAWLETPALPGAALAALLLLAAASVPVTLVLQALALRLLGGVRPGVVSARSLAAIRIGLKTSLVDAACRWLSGTLFWPWWLRLAGMRVGRDCEISTVIDVVPETVAVGAGSFFADGIYFCSPWRHRGTVTVAETALGPGTFLGNHAVVPAGERWPDDFFVGVATVAPKSARPGSAWFGHPPLELPRREVVTADRRVTHRPGPIRYASRLFWESLRFTLPALPLLVGCAWYWGLAAVTARAGPVGLLGAAPGVTFAALAVLALAALALKWLLLGRVRPGQHPLWSCWCSRWDFLYVAWDYWARGVLAPLEGTLLLNAFLRLTGMRLGRRVVLGDGFAQVVDPDMLTVEDDATVTCHFQAHSFEDRVLKIDRLRVGRGATVGFNAVVFYGADVGDGATVAPHSVVMKRDALAPGGEYAGHPTQRRG